LAWGDPAASARFVNAGRAKQLETLGISRIGELLYHVPYRYLDLTSTAQLGPVSTGDATVVGTVYEVTKRKTYRSPGPKRKQLTITEVTLTDGTGTLIGVWFNQPWVERSYAAGQVLAFSGEVKLRNGLKQIVQPFVEKIADVPAEHSSAAEGVHISPDSAMGSDVDMGDSLNMGRVLPVHSTTEGLSVGWLRRVIAAAIDDYGQVGEYLPMHVLQNHDLAPYSWALQQIHFPTTLADADTARKRLAFGELLDLQLLIARRRYRLTRQATGHTHQVLGAFHQALSKQLPFSLTNDQDQAVTQILDDMTRSYPMQRLLLGDVGTGKTIVAAFALAVAADSGGQAAMMAPTEVLAQQYAKKLGPMFDQMGLRWALLTGATAAADKQQILDDLAGGQTQVIFGTHALLEDKVEFANLTLVVVDEQHRFGVQQRRALHSKGQSADVLVMSATPIPRTLTLTAFGDLAASYLRTRPIAGAGITTKKVKFSNIAAAYDAVHVAVKQGQQAYVVCALVDESASIEAQSALRMAQHLAADEFSAYRVEVLTGKMKPADKTRIMDDFRAGKIDVLVSTTVIEVGVDVHNATVMLVLDADRYGLAQLHQLRGRVGRGKQAGEVWLVSDSFSHASKERFAALLDTDDGFRLAELDLKQRGAGELLGNRQSGVAHFKVADLSTDADLLEAARTEALSLIAADPQLQADEIRVLQVRIEALEKKLGDWKVAG